jgi:transposase
MRSIFRKRNPDVEALFEKAGLATKVMCVAFDYAKKIHTAVVCDGSGRQLRGVFNVENNRAGLDYLLGIVASLCRKHKIKHEHVFYGGEDCGAYAFNFIHALVSRGFLVVGINTKQAKDERENSKASTDLIDTVGVAGMMIKMKGRTIGEATEDVHGLKRLRRQRGAILKAHSASAHRTYRIVDELFPGFLAQESSGITPFSRASLWLMEERFSAAEVHARQKPALVRKLREFSLGDPEGVALKLKVLAEIALPPSEAMIPALQRSLAEELSIYRLTSASLHGMDSDIAKQLARTPGAMLTTMPGLGLRWAPALYAELGDPIRRRNVHSMAALGGLVPRLKQSGGPNKPAVIGHRTKGCSSFLKQILISGAVSLSQYGHPEIREAYQLDKAMGRDARTRMAQHLLRVSLHMIDHQTFYLPPSLHQGGTREQIRDYYVKMWPKVLVKWRDRGAILEAVAEGAPLRQWRDMVQELYDIELSIKSPQTGRK